MKTAYVVTSGEYSGYRIDAVFSSRKKAQEYIDANRSEWRWQSTDIEVWPVDKWQQVRGRTYWTVHVMDANDVSEPTTAWSYDPDVSRVDDEPLIQRLTKSVTTIGLDGDYTKHQVVRVPYWEVRYVEAEDEEHAIKIAAERVAMHAAQLAGIG